MNDRTKAAIVGGLVAGIPSVIPLISTCCFIWAIAGGFLAVFMYMKNAPTPMSPGDGAKLGAMAGGVGAIIYLLVSVPLMLLGGAANIAAQMERSGGEAAGMAGLAAGLGFAVVFVVAGILLGLGAAGGAIGAAVLNKNRPGGTGTPPPPPPADFGSGGGYGGTGTGGYGGPGSGGGYGGTPTGGSDLGGPAGGGTAGAGGTGGGSTFGTGS